MSGHGGSRPGAGRKPGARNKRIAAQIKAIEDSGLTPLDYMLSILRDEDKTESVRLQAAKDAAPYVHQKLQSLEVETITTTNHVVSDKPLNIDEWEEKYSDKEETVNEDNPGETKH